MRPSVSRTLWSVMSSHAAARQVPHEMLNVAHGDGIDAGEGLVEENEARLARQRPCDLARRRSPPEARRRAPCAGA